MNEATLRFSLRADALGANPCASLREAVRKPLIWPDTDEGILVLGQNTPRYSRAVYSHVV